MLTITDMAVEKLKEALVAEGKAEWGLRIFFSGSGCCGPSFGMDIEETPNDGDKVTEISGLKIFTDQNTTPQVTGMSIDFVDDGQNQGFVLKGPPQQESSSCGCAGGKCP